MGKRLLMVVMILVVSCAIIFAGGGSDSSAPQINPKPSEVIIYGGTTGDSWNIFTTVVGGFLPRHIPGIRTTVSPGAAFSNVQGVNDGQITLAISKLPTTFDGYAAKAPFKAPTDNVVNMGFLYDEHTHIIVNADSDIHSIADLKGKRCTTFAKGNTAEVIFRDLLSVYDMTYDDLGSITFSNLNDMAEQFKDGLTDCLCFASALPVSVVLDIVSSRDIRLIDIPDDKLAAMQEISPAYLRQIIPAGTYQGVDTDCYTMGNAQHMIVNKQLDEEFVYQMTKAIVEELPTIGAGHVVYANLTPEMMAQDLGIPMHPGAERYYKEIGAM